MSEVWHSDIQKFGYNNILSTFKIRYLLLILWNLLVIQDLVKMDFWRRCSKKVRGHFILVWMHLNDKDIGLPLHWTDFCEGIRVINIKWWTLPQFLHGLEWRMETGLAGLWVNMLLWLQVNRKDVCQGIKKGMLLSIGSCSLASH